MQKTYSSLYTVSKTKINNILSVWKKNIPYIKPYYAVKCFNDQYLLKTIHKYNYGFDCASKGEIKKIITTVPNINPKTDIIFANPCKSTEDIIYSKNKNINLYTADSVEEIYKLEKYHPYSKVLVRIIADETYSLLPFSSKFGANRETTINILNKLKYGSVEFNGFSFHLGSNCTDISGWKNSLKLVQEYVEMAKQHNNLETKIIDIGGGFMNESQIIDLKNIIPNNTNIKYIAEPGRLFARTVVDIYVKIIAVRVKNNIYNVTVNDSTYGNFNAIIWDEQKFTPIPLWENKEMVTVNIFGQTCDSKDIICSEIILPQPKVGEWIKFENAGAYTISASAYFFNGFGKSKKIYV